MKDEEFCFVSDVREKKITARSARNRKTHAGKGGRVKFPSDYLTNKELKAMNGECKSYRLNEPMKWDEFKTMPDDLKISYVKLLRERFDVPDCKIGEMLGASKDQIWVMFKQLGLNGTSKRKRKDWNIEGWLTWCNGIPLPDPVEEPLAVSEDVGRGLASLEDIADPEPVPVVNILPVRKEPVKAIPESGNMTFMGSAEAALNAVGVLLGGANVRICISWEALAD